jgi:hypothetical protein
MSGQHVMYRTVAGACLVTLLLAGCDSADPAEPAGPNGPDEPAVQGLQVEARTDTMLTGTVGATITAVPVVRVTLNGAAAPGRDVVFRASGGGTVEIQSQRTDTAGLASPGSWKLGTKAQPQTLTAWVTGARALVFTAVAKAAQPDTMRFVAGNHQTAAAGAQLSTPLRIRLADRYGNPVPDWTVGYGTIAGGGSVSGGTVKSDSLGIATSGPWTLGSAGPQAVISSVGGMSLFFDAFACGDPCRGRDLLFVDRDKLYFLVNGVPTLLFTAPSGSLPGSPAWSPDGRKVAFVVEEHDYDGELLSALTYIMDADGSHAAPLDDGSHPSWSQDGTRLAVTRGEEVYTLSAEAGGSAPVLLAEHGWDPAWSPAAAKIAFMTNVEGHVVLRIVNADGSLVTTIPLGDEFSAYGPTWSPDGARLAFTRCVYTCQVFTVTAAGAELTQLTAESAWQPAWSPDGSRIALVTANGIAWVPLTGSFRGPIPMTQGASPAWRP